MIPEDANGADARQILHVALRFAAQGDAVPNQEDDRDERDADEPIPPQAQCPKEIDAAQEAEEQRRIAERGEQSAQVTDEEDEENGEVAFRKALGVDLEVR